MGDNGLPLCRMKDFSGLENLSIMMGTACNMCCRHCTQTPVRKDDVHGFKLSPKVWDLVRNFIRFHSDERNPALSLPLIFWGGEPLLYWDSIKECVLRIEEEFGRLDRRRVRFMIVSNGLLLDSGIVGFLNEHGVDFGLSYDAPYPNAVRSRIPDSVCGLVNRIEYSAVFGFCNNRYNCDPLLAYRCLCAKFPSVRVVNVSPNLTMSFSMPKDIYAFDWDAVRRNYRKLRISAQLNDRFALDWIWKRYLKDIHDGKGVSVADRIMKCTVSAKDLGVTPDGRCSFCSNSDVFLSTVDDSWETFVRRRKEYGNSFDLSECMSCRHSDICGKHCLLDMRDADGMFVSCKEYLLPLFDIVKDELRKLSFPVSREDVEWYRRQERLMEKQVEVFLREGSL